MSTMRLPDPPASMSFEDRNYFNQLIKSIRFALMVNNNTSCFGSVTLSPNVGSTTVSNNTFKGTDTIILTPTTASASVEVSIGELYVTAGDGSFVITHDNDPVTDRVFNYAVLR